MASSEKGERRKSGDGSETKVKIDDTDALFALSLAEFTGARNALAASLKQAGRGEEAARVKALAKPSVSAWAVNQLYWKHRKAFDRLMLASQSLRHAQAAQLAGKVSDMRGPLVARREALSELSHLASALLHDEGHNPSPDVMRRIGTTLEAMSAYESPLDASPGHLTADLDPPGFESLAALIPGAISPARTNRPAPVADTRDRKETRQATIAAAKVSLQNAERVLSEARARAQHAGVALKRTSAEAKEAERQKREAGERFEKARAALQEADQRARTAAAEAEQAAKAVALAERTVEKTSGELRLLLPDSPADH